MRRADGMASARLRCDIFINEYIYRYWANEEVEKIN